ncbi:MAG: c-type cytochrome [Candidatus Acidiferrales bacterium]
MKKVSLQRMLAEIRPISETRPGMVRQAAGVALIAMAAAVFALAQSGLAAQNQKPDTKTAAASAGNADKGKLAFASHGCAACHGSEGQGATAPRLAPPPLPLPAFVKIVRQPADQMPPFSPEAISDSDLVNVYAYLKSSASAAPSQAAPTGHADAGKRLFMSYGCFECHGTVGQGSTQTGGVRIGPPAISFEAMVQYVHHPTGEMPPYTSKVVSEHDLADIYAYLKSQPQPAANIPLLQQ